MRSARTVRWRALSGADVTESYARLFMGSAPPRGAGLFFRAEPAFALPSVDPCAIIPAPAGDVIDSLSV